MTRLSLLGVIFFISVTVFGSISVARAQATDTQATGRRFALVIGEAAYSGKTVQTVTADVAVVAQSLRDEGFAVTELHDLAAADLGTSWQMFVAQLSAAPASSTVVIYTSGLAVQYGCDDWLLPVDAQITQASDVVRIGLSMKRVMADLSRTGSAASMVLLDGARDLPQSVSAVAFPRGLIGLPAPAATAFGLSEEPHDVLPLPQPADVNGAYGLAIANILKQPIAGLDTFLREVRIQVHQQTGGQQTPWHRTGPFMPDVVLSQSADAAQIQAAAVTLPNATSPIGSLAAEDAYWASIWRNTIDGYTAYLAAFATTGSPELVARVREILAQLRVPDPPCTQAPSEPPLAPHVLPLAPPLRTIDVCPQGFRPAGGYNGAQCVPIAPTPTPACPSGFSPYGGADNFYCQKNGPPVPSCPPGLHPQWDGQGWLCAGNPPPPPTVCPPGSFAKWNGVQWFCAPNGPPRGPECPPGTVPTPSGVCVLIVFPPGGTCAPGQVRLPGMPPGTCATNPPNPGDCGPGTTKLPNGLCVPNPTGGGTTTGVCAPPNFLNAQGRCVTNTPVSCPAGFRITNGQCLPNPVQSPCPLGDTRGPDGLCEQTKCPPGSVAQQ